MKSLVQNDDTSRQLLAEAEGEMGEFKKVANAGGGLGLSARGVYKASWRLPNAELGLLTILKNVYVLVQLSSNLLSNHVYVLGESVDRFRDMIDWTKGSLYCTGSKSRPQTRFFYMNVDYRFLLIRFHPFSYT